MKIKGLHDSSSANITPNPLAKTFGKQNEELLGSMSNACESFMAKWAEFNENTEMDPTDMVWSEFLQSNSFGLNRVENLGQANTSQQLAGNINRFFAEDNYDEQLTPEEADFVWNLWQRRNVQVPDDILISCNVLNTIVNTPADQLNSINWDMFDGVVSGSEEEGDEDRPFGSDESDEGFAPVTFPPPASLQPTRVPFPAPTTQFPAQTFPTTGFGQPPSLTSQQPTPAPAIGFNPQATNPLAPAQPLTSPLAPPPTAVAFQQPQTGFGLAPQRSAPGGLLSGGAPQAPFTPPQTTTTTGHDLPYVTTVVKGLKPSDTSRVLLLNIDDDGTGNKIQVAVFITAGAVPATVINTTFSTDEYDFRDKQQKSRIHEQNKRVITEAKQLIPFNLSNGVDEKGVCAQIVRGYQLQPVGDITQDCPEGGNRARSVGMAAPQQTVATPPTSTGRGLFGQTMPTQPGLGQTPAGQVTFGTQPQFSSQQATGITSTGFTTPPTSGGFASAPTSGTGLGPEVAPAGTRAITVPDFDKPGSFREAYQIPGGPHPIAVGKKVGQNPGTWYWYQLPNGGVIKSEQKYLGLLDKGFTTKHGEKQLRRVDEILQLMRGQYGPNFNQVTATPTATGVVPQKSSGRGKAAGGAKSGGRGKAKEAPAVGGFVATQPQLPPGFGPAQPTGFQATAAPNFFQAPPSTVFQTAAPTAQTGFQSGIQTTIATTTTTGQQLPAGFQAALPPPIGTTPGGLLQPQLPNFQAIPPPTAAPPTVFGSQPGQVQSNQQQQGLFGGFQAQATLAQRADALATPLQPPNQTNIQPTGNQQGTVAQGNSRPEANPLFALLQNQQQQTSTIPAGLFNQPPTRR